MIKPTFALLKKELKSHFNSPMAYIVVVLFIVVPNLIFFLNFWAQNQATMQGYFALLPWVFLLFIPALTMGVWSNEKKSGTLELLFTYPVSNYQIYLSKYFATFIIIGIALLLTLPIPILVHILRGDFDWGQVFGQYFGALLLACTYIAIGFFFSSIFNDQIISFLLSSVTVFLLIIIGIFPTRYEFAEMFKPLAYLFIYMGITNHFDNFSVGVISLRDLFYYLIITTIFIYLNLNYLKVQKWRIKTRTNVFNSKEIIMGIGMFVFSVAIVFVLYFGLIIAINKEIGSVHWVYFWYLVIILLFALSSFYWYSKVRKGDYYTLSFRNNLAFILVILNLLTLTVITNRISFKLDLSEGQQYSLSKVSKKMLKSLENKVVIRYYYSNKMKELQRFAPIIKYIPGILNEYASSSGGNLEVFIKDIDPSEDTETMTQIRQDGIQEFTANETVDTMEAKSVIGFSGIVIEYQGNKELLPVVVQTTELEYEITSRILKLTREAEKKIGILVGDAKIEFEKKSEKLLEALRDEIEIEILEKEKAIPFDMTTLLVVGADELTDFQQYQIDQFIMHGGRVIFTYNSVNVTQSPYGGFQGIPTVSKLNKMLDHYGITVNTDIVHDAAYNVMLPFRTGANMTSWINYSPWIRVSPKNVQEPHAVTSNLDMFVFPWTSSVVLKDSVKEEKSSLKGKIIASSSQYSYNQKSNYQLNPQMLFRPQKSDLAKFDLAGELSGIFTSYYKNKDKPEQEDQEAEQLNIDHKDKSSDTKIIVIPDSDFLIDQWMQVANTQGNIQLLFNIFDYLAKEDELIAVRSKGRTNRPLDNKVIFKAFAGDPDALKTYFRVTGALINVFCTWIIPVILTLIGLGRYFKRRKLRKRKVTS